MSDQLFLLQDSRGLVGDNLMFWDVGGGYTSDILKADRFSKADAVAQHECRNSDIPWPAEYFLARHYIAVDMQNLRNVDRNSKDIAFYRQLPGQYIGNDVMWVTADEASTDLRIARVFSELSSGFPMWPVEEIQKISRPVVRARDVSLKDALAGTGIVLSKPKKIRRDVFNCHQCGRFISEDNRYFDCQNCGGDNRP